MPPDGPATFAPDDLDVLQELMNIGFGSASAALAESLGTSIVLRVPQVQVMPAVLFRYYVSAELKDLSCFSVFEQEFAGELQGTAFLILPAGAGKLLAPLRRNDASGSPPGTPAQPEGGNGPEDNALVKAGNILIRGCLAKLGELLRTAVRFAQPTVNVGAGRGEIIRADLLDPTSSTVILRTTFCFGDGDLSGFLFLAVGRDSVQWLRGALPRFMAQYT